MIRYLQLWLAALLLASWSIGAFGAPRTVTWTAPDDVTFLHGYRVHWGYAPGQYKQTVDAGMATNATIDLPTDRNVWLALTAYNAVGIDGPYSAELVHDVEDKVGRPDPPRARWAEAVVAWLRRVLGINQ